MSEPSGGPVNTLLLVLLTILMPPVGVFLVSGCGADLIINICLTILGYFPGHIHAFWVEYQYFNRREREGVIVTGNYRDNPNNSGANYGTV